MLGDMQSWEIVKKRYPIGSMVSAAVVQVVPFGVFITLELDGIGLIKVPELAGVCPKRSPVDYPQHGEIVTARVIWHDDRKCQINLTQQN